MQWYLVPVVNHAEGSFTPDALGKEFSTPGMRFHVQKHQLSPTEGLFGAPSAASVPKTFVPLTIEGAREHFRRLFSRDPSPEELPETSR